MQVILGALAGLVVLALLVVLAVEFVLRGNKPATICRAALDGEPRCTRLALPGGRFCRKHEEFFRAQVSA
jgi:hypothetical protein